MKKETIISNLEVLSDKLRLAAIRPNKALERLQRHFERLREFKANDSKR